MISKPGFYPDVPEAEYHADPVKAMSLSSDVAKAMALQSPRHAKHKHPRLTPPAPDMEETERAPTRPMCIGNAAHKILLGKGRAVDVIEGFDDYKKKEPKEARDASLAAGNVPVLGADMEHVNAMVEAAREQLADLGHANLFEGGDAEVTMVWQEKNGVWCRSRPDYVHKDSLKGGHIIIPELKTTGGSAHPDDWSSTCANMGHDYQACLRERGMMKLVPGLKSAEILWCVIEQKPPYGLALVEMDNQTREEIGAMIDIAIEGWGVCLQTGKWPSYERGMLDAKPWRSMSTELRRRALLDRIAHWQRPL